MQRSVLFSLALGLAFAGLVGCLSDLEDLCQTDADCPGTQRCRESDGVKFCAAEPTGTGGIGGGGDGGDGGGPGGSGGVGGSGGAAPFEAVVELEIVPSDGLADFLAELKEFERRVGSLSLSYETGGSVRNVEVPLSEPSLLPLASIEARLPMETASETIELKVSANALRIDESLAPFAFGAVTEEFSDQEKTKVSISLELDVKFDFDLDETPDATDCDPHDGEVYPGAEDLCDGKLQACGQPYCLIELEKSETVRDISCSVSERKCAAVIASGESGKVRIYGEEFPSEPVEVEGVEKAKGIAWNSAGSQSHLLIIEPELVSFSDASGDRLAAHIVPSLDLAGPVHSSIHGNVAVAPGVEPFTLQVFDPASGSTLPGGESCDSDSHCTPLGVGSIFGGETGLPGDSVISGAAIYRQGGIGNIAVYLHFANDSRLGYLQLNSSRAIREENSGLYAPFPEGTKIRFIASFGEDERLFFGLQGPDQVQSAAWVKKEAGLGVHKTPVEIELPPNSCPAALDAKRSESSLLMADDCTGTLWELPLDEEGKPTGENFDPYSLGEHCKKPFVLDSLPAAGEQDAMTFVGCEGENHILVLGRH